MDTLGLVLRVGLSLACVLALIWLFGKGVLKAPGARAAAGSSVRMLGRQQLSRSASVAVVGVGERALVLGVSDQGVTLLSRMTLEELAVEPAPAVTRRTALDLTTLADPPRDHAAQPPSTVTPATATPAAELAAAAGAVADVPRQRGALHGSALSPQTWAQALDVVRERTTRR